MHHDIRHQNLLTAVRDAYVSHPDMMGFLPFPQGIEPENTTPYHCTCSDIFRDDVDLFSETYADLQDAIKSAGQIAHWRETYKGTDIGDDFMDKFGCYCIIGENGPFSSDVIRLYMVYMPPSLYYPWHNHPAEEIYLVVSGNAVFKRKDMPDEILSEGDTSFHKSNQPHAMETLTSSTLCLVAWRNNFETPPVLSN